MIKTVQGKMGNMRKPDSWVLYPQKDLGKVLIQCDKRIAEVDLESGVATLSTKGSTFIHLSPGLGAIQVIVPNEMLEELRKLCQENKPGDGIGTTRLTH